MKKALALILVFVLCLAVSGTAAVAEESRGNITVTFWNAWTGSDGDYLTQLVNKFNEENAYGITVDMTITSSFTEMMQTGLPTGQAADLVLDGVNGINTYDGYYRSISDLWENTTLKQDDFLNCYLDGCYKDGNLYGVPFQISTFFLYWNKDLFTAAGLDPESPPTTFAQWTEYANKITNADKKIYGSGLFYCYNGQNTSVLHRFGGLYVSETDGKYSVNLAGNQGLMDGLNWMYDLYASGNNPYEKDIDSMMKAGQIGIMVNGGWLKAGLDEAGINYGMAKIPVVEGDNIENYSLGDESCFFITTSADDDQAWACEKFIEWWFLGTEGTDVQDTANTGWSLNMGYVGSYIPTIQCEAYQGNAILSALSVSPDSNAQTVMFAPSLSLVYSDVANSNTNMVEEWVMGDGTEETLTNMLATYQEELESSVVEHYGEGALAQ
jgi:multiple sugar transport system substrate-binding protein